MKIIGMLYFFLLYVFTNRLRVQPQWWHRLLSPSILCHNMITTWQQGVFHMSRCTSLCTIWVTCCQWTQQWHDNGLCCMRHHTLVVHSVICIEHLPNHYSVRLSLFSLQYYFPNLDWSFKKHLSVLFQLKGSFIYFNQFIQNAFTPPNWCLICWRLLSSSGFRSVLMQLMHPSD